MGDNKAWFKVWTSMLSDPDMMGLDMSDKGRWLTLMAYAALHGEKGHLQVKSNILCHILHLEEPELQKVLSVLPNVLFTPENGHGKMSVTFSKWYKYQVDSTYLERKRRQRDTENVTMQEEKRREEKRREKNKKKNNTISPQESISDFTKELKESPAYNGIDVEREIEKMKVWFTLPKNKGRKLTKKFAMNWLNKIEKPLIDDQQTKKDPRNSSQAEIREAMRGKNV